MQSAIQNVSKKRLWTGRVISALPALFLLLDGIMKLVKPAPVVEAMLRLGYPESVILGLGIVLTVLIWGGLYLRDGRLRALIPLRMQTS